MVFVKGTVIKRFLKAAGTLQIVTYLIQDVKSGNVDRVQQLSKSLDVNSCFKVDDEVELPVVIRVYNNNVDLILADRESMEEF